MPTTYIKSDLKENTIHIPHTAQALRSVVTFAYWQTLQAPPDTDGLPLKYVHFGPIFCPKTQLPFSSVNL